VTVLWTPSVEWSGAGPLAMVCRQVAPASIVVSMNEPFQATDVQSVIDRSSISTGLDHARGRVHVLPSSRLSKIAGASPMTIRR
jgi:hypothetical protein